jgi:DNA-directed RNA polymerase subunit N (RpoN/RPB10)
MLYVTVRCFSFAKYIVSKYKGVKQKKALRKDLKKDSSELK